MRISKKEHLWHKAKLFKSNGCRDMQRMDVPSFGEHPGTGQPVSGCPSVTACRHQCSQGYMEAPHAWQLSSISLLLSSLVGCQVGWNTISPATLQSSCPWADSLWSAPSSWQFRLAHLHFKIVRAVILWFGYE